MNRSHLALVAALLLLPCLDAAAAAQRTFVSSAGNDANTTANCSLASPCRSFASALTVTGTGGEIVVLDSGGYGRVTIDKSVSIIAPDGIYAGITVPAGTNGVDVAGANIVVALRGLTINGQGGNVGISFLQGLALHIERCTVSNMRVSGVSLEAGTEFEARAYITDTTIGEGGILDANGAGIYAAGNMDVSIVGTNVAGFFPRGMLAYNGPRVAIANSVFSGNQGAGIAIWSFDPSMTMATISNSTVSGAISGIQAQAVGAGTGVKIAVSHVAISSYDGEGVGLGAYDGGNVVAVISDSTMFGSVKGINVGCNNCGDGISADGAGVSATISANAIAANLNAGVEVKNGAVVKTLKNNVIQNNATNILGTLSTVAGD